MGRATALALQCPVDSRHAAFKGSQHVCYDVALELDAAGTARAHTVGSLLYDLSEPRDHEIRCGACGATVWRPRRPISFVPSDGMILLCDFSTGFRPPEMVKMRPVVILSRHSRNRQTCSVVPLSTVVPADHTSRAHELDASKYFFLNRSTWAKCDMVTSVSRERLFLLRDPASGRGIDSRRTMIDECDLLAIRHGVARALGMALTC